MKEDSGIYHAILGAIPDCVYVCSSDSRIEYMNPAMVRSLGRDATGDRCYEAIYDRETPCPWCAAGFGERGADTGRQWPTPRNSHQYAISCQPVPQPNGDTSQMTILRDITELKKREQDIKELEEQLLQLQKMDILGSLVGEIIHDFNNILQAIEAYSELAMMEIGENAEARHFMTEIQTAVERARALVRHIMAFCHRSEENAQPIEVAPLIEETLRLLRASIPASIEIRQEIRPGCGYVFADPTRIHQVLMNLCTNAYYAMRATGGTLTVSLEEDRATGENLTKSPPRLRLTVRDTGCGMDAVTLKHIFNPFFTTKPVGEGTGFGLAVVEKIIHAYGGEISVESEPGKGSTFTVCLPLYAAPEPPQTPPGNLWHGAGYKVIHAKTEEPFLPLCR